MSDDPDKTPTLDEERPTQPKAFEVCPVCKGHGKLAEELGPQRFRPRQCPECHGAEVVPIERYRELTGRKP